MLGRQHESIRRLVGKRLESTGTSDAVEYVGRDGLRTLAARVKARGRKRLTEMRDRPDHHPEEEAAS
jgi:hypothetical protein